MISHRKTLLSRLCHVHYMVHEQLLAWCLRLIIGRWMHSKIYRHHFLSYIFWGIINLISNLRCQVLCPDHQIEIRRVLSCITKVRSLSLVSHLGAGGLYASISHVDELILETVASVHIVELVKELVFLSAVESSHTKRAVVLLSHRGLTSEIRLPIGIRLNRVKALRQPLIIVVYTP